MRKVKLPSQGNSKLRPNKIKKTKSVIYRSITCIEKKKQLRYIYIAFSILKHNIASTTKMRCTAFVATMLDCHHGIDIAPALSETRISEETQFEKVGGEYTFYCRGKEECETRTSGVGFDIRTSITC